MKRSIFVIFALLLCLALLPAVAMAADSDDSWIEEKLREIEENYNPDIMLLSFVEGHIPWSTEDRQYFTVSGLPGTISKEQWLKECKQLSPDGYNVDNTGVKYTKFPQYNDDGYHFVNVTVNNVDVVRLGILVPDDNPNGEPVYYYMTQKHVDSDDTSDGSGSHTGSISALLLPDDATFQVNYAINEYNYSYQIKLDNEDVTDLPVDPNDPDSVTWLQSVFAGQNPASTTGGAVSFPVTIPFGYTARVLRYEYDDATDTWSEEPLDLTGSEAPHPANEGYPLGTEPVYEFTYDTDKNGAVRLKENKDGERITPSVLRMSDVFYDEQIQQDRRIVVELQKVTKLPVFDAHFWVGTTYAKVRGTVGYDKGWKGNTKNPDNIITWDGWGWKNDNHEDKPLSEITPCTIDHNDLENALKYRGNAYYMWENGNGTYDFQWTFQTNSSENYLLDSLELNGVYLTIPFIPETNVSVSDEEAAKSIGKAGTYSKAALPDGAEAKLRFVRRFGDQRVYTLTITGASSNVTVTGGNLMQFRNGAAEFIPSNLTGVTTNQETGVAAIYAYNLFEGKGWIEAPVSQPVVTGHNKMVNQIDGQYGFNIAFQLVDGYEAPVFSWCLPEGDTVEGSSLLPEGKPTVRSELPANGALAEKNVIYGPIKYQGNEYYCIRLVNMPNDNQKLYLLNITAAAMKYMVRYMVGSQNDAFTNAPSEDNDNVQGMPKFSTDDSNWDDELIPKDDEGNPLPDGGGLEGRYLERYDDNGGAFYDRQTTPIISVSDAQPTTKDGTKFFQHWVLVDKDENVIKGLDGKPITIEPNGTITLADVAHYGVALNTDIGSTDSNYYVLRLKGVWSDLPDEFKFYIRMVWTDENGKSHIMDLVQNVTTSSTDRNLTDDDCLIVTVNTVTDTFKDWFKAHPFYAYAPRNFIATSERDSDRFTDHGKDWEIYPSDFTSGSAEQGLKNPNAYYRVEVGDDGIVRYIVQREGTIILYLNEVNGSLPIGKTVIGSNPGADKFTYTVTVRLLASDIARASLMPGDPNYLTPESLENMLPSGSYFGFAPTADMTDLKAFNGTDVEVHFRRDATARKMEDWYSTATFTLCGGQATVLGVPQGSYTITEEVGEAYTVTVETDGKVFNHTPTLSGKVVEAGKTASAVKYTNEVTPIEVEDSPRVSTEFTGDNLPDDLEATFSYLLELVSGDSSQVEYTSEGTTLTIPCTQEDGKSVFKNTGAPFGNITFKHTGTYQFLVTETLESFKGVEENTILPSTSTRSLAIVVENINGQLTVTKITVDGTVYTGATLENAVVPFTHIYMPIAPDAVRVIPTVYKKLHGRELLSAAFAFELTAPDGTTTYKATNNAAANGARGTVTFPPIDFTTPGTYEVTIREIIPTGDDAEESIDYDADLITITYSVDEVDGKLQVTEVYKDGKDTFENQAYADTSFRIRKNYDLSKRPGGRWNTDTFTVTVTLTSAPTGAQVDVNGETIALNGAAKIVLRESDKANGQIANLHFTNEGTYTFEVLEENGRIPGVSYDGSVYEVTVTVTAEGKSLAADLSITKNGKAFADSAVTFDNKYDPTQVDVNLTARKVLLDANGNQIQLATGRFRFELAPAGQTGGSILTAKNNANGTVAFTLQNMSEGIYQYTLREIDDGEKGVAYDPREYAVTVIVELLPGNSAVTYTVLYDDAEVDPTFTNTISGFGQLIVSNAVTGNKADPDKEFTYTLTFGGTSGALRYELRSSAGSYGLFDLVMPLFAPESATVAGTLSSGDRIQLRDGQSVIIYGLPMGASYTVVESDYDEYAVSHDGIPGDTVSGVIAGDNTAVNYLNALYYTDPDYTDPDVTISKMQSVNGAASASPAMVEAGDQVTYTITVKNTGELPARAVTVTDAVPAGLVVQDIDNGGQNNQGTITWTLDELAAEDSQSVSFTVTVPAIATDQTWINTATVVWDGETTGKTAAPVMLHATAVGDLTLSKTIMAASGAQIDTDREFSFTVKLTDGDSPYSGSFSYEGGIVPDSGATAPTGGTLVLDENGEATVILKHGQTITIREIPAGLSYVVTEATAAGYIPSISNGNGRIEANIATEVSATNTYSLASVTAAVPEITKTLTGRSLEPDEFTFVISCDPMDGVTLPGMVANDADGKVQFDHITFTKPGTYQVTVREVIPVDALDNTKDGVTYDTHAVEFTYVVADNHLGGLTVTEPTVGGEGGENATSFNNTFADEPVIVSTGRLAVRKQVTGNAGDLQAKFTFTILLSDTSISGTYGDVAFSKGVATFTLKHGETKTASGLPAGIRYSVHEQAANQDGYATASSGETGVITANTTMTAIFVNAKDVVDIPQTGDNSHVETWLAMSLAALVSMIGCLSIKRRKMGVRK